MKQLLNARTILDFEDSANEEPVKLIGDQGQSHETERKQFQGYGDFLNVTTKLKLGKLKSIQTTVQQEQVIWLFHTEAWRSRPH